MFMILPNIVGNRASYHAALLSNAVVIKNSKFCMRTLETVAIIHRSFHGVVSRFMRAHSRPQIFSSKYPSIMLHIKAESQVAITLCLASIF
jgi:hypothetical protein